MIPRNLYLWIQLVRIRIDWEGTGMGYPALGRCTLFSGMSAEEIREVLEETPHHIEHYEKGELVFRLTEPATRVAIILEGRVEAQKPFPDGSQVNVSVRVPGDLIGPAAAFARERTYPCDIVALEPIAAMIFRRDDLMHLMQRDERVLENFVVELATAAHMLQQRLELLSYRGIAQKAAFWLLTQARRGGRPTVPIPGSVTRWAELMNVSRPSLHRELRRLDEQGLISYAPPLITILDADALEAMLGQ